MRMLLIGGATFGVLAALVLLLSAYGGSSTSSASEQATQRKADLWDIDQLEKRFHKATTRKDIDLMMSLFAPNATFTFPGTTAVGKEQIRRFWLTKSLAFKPENNWISLTTAYKVRITVNGDRGTLYFDCEYTIPKKGEVDDEVKGEVVVVTAADGDVARINGTWLITSLAGASATLGP